MPLDHVTITRSPQASKLLLATLVFVQPTGTITRHVHFGARGYDQYPVHKDKARRDRYIERHQRNENWADPTTPGFWARWILWNLPTIEESARDVSERLGVPVIVR